MRKTKISTVIFNIFNYTVLGLLAFICLFPFIQLIGQSFTSAQELVLRDIVIFPKEISFEAYNLIFSEKTIPRSLLVSLFVTVVGTLTNLFFTTITAFALSREALKGRRVIMLMIVFTMIFNGGMIPTYLVVQGLGMLNSYSALIIPGAISAFNLILMRNFFMQLPEELFESAYIDGASDLTIFTKIVLPLSKASLATFTLFYAVGHWNDFMSAFLYITDTDKWPIQVWLRDMVVLATHDFSESGMNVSVPSKSLQSATIVVATLPILIVYPFVQKHFAKGVMVGLVKG